MCFLFFSCFKKGKIQHKSNILKVPTLAWAFRLKSRHLYSNHPLQARVQMKRRQYLRPHFRTVFELGIYCAYKGGFVEKTRNRLKRQPTSTGFSSSFELNSTPFGSSSTMSYIHELVILFTLPMYLSSLKLLSAGLERAGTSNDLHEMQCIFLQPVLTKRIWQENLHEGPWQLADLWIPAKPCEIWTPILRERRRSHACVYTAGPESSIYELRV